MNPSTDRFGAPTDDLGGTSRGPGSRRLLTTREVAEYLGLSPATVLRRWRVGEIPGYRLASNVLRFDPDDLDAWLAAARRGPTEAGSSSRPAHQQGASQEDRAT